jgi:hypothetical protein
LRWRIGKRKLELSQVIRLDCPHCGNQFEIEGVELVIFDAGAESFPITAIVDEAPCSEEVEQAASLRALRSSPARCTRSVIHAYDSELFESLPDQRAHCLLAGGRVIRGLGSKRKAVAIQLVSSYMGFAGARLVP